MELLQTFFKQLWSDSPAALIVIPLILFAGFNVMRFKREGYKIALDNAPDGSIINIKTGKIYQIPEGLSNKEIQEFLETLPGDDEEENKDGATQ